MSRPAILLNLNWLNLSRPAILLKTKNGWNEPSCCPAEYLKWLIWAVLLSSLKLKIVEMSRPDVLLISKILKKSRPAVLLKTENDWNEPSCCPAKTENCWIWAVLLSCLKLKMAEMSRPAILLNWNWLNLSRPAILLKLELCWNEPSYYPA